MTALALALCMACCPEQIPAPLEDPPISDLRRFPPLEVAALNRDIADAHIDWLQEQIAYYPSRFEYLDWLQEAKRLRSIWRALKIAQNSGFTDGWRRECLAELRDMLGPDYYRGVMPCPVPVHRFRRN